MNNYIDKRRNSTSPHKYFLFATIGSFLITTIFVGVFYNYIVIPVIFKFASVFEDYPKFIIIFFSIILLVLLVSMYLIFHMISDFFLNNDIIKKVKDFYLLLFSLSSIIFTFIALFFNVTVLDFLDLKELFNEEIISWIKLIYLTILSMSVSGVIYLMVKDYKIKHK